MHKKTMITVTGLQKRTWSPREERCKVAMDKALLFSSVVTLSGSFAGPSGGRPGQSRGRELGTASNPVPPLLLKDSCPSAGGRLACLSTRTDCTLLPCYPQLT